MNAFRNILVAIDLGDVDSSRQVFDAALESFHDGDKIAVICVVPNFGTGVVGSFFPKDHAEKALEAARQALHQFTSDFGPKDIQIKHIIAQGSVYEEIIDNANKLDVDLIVVGSHRPELKDYLLGPNAARVVRHAKQSVLVVRK